jgi:hypothetical protein
MLINEQNPFFDCQRSCACDPYHHLSQSQSQHAGCLEMDMEEVAENSAQIVGNNALFLDYDSCIGAIERVGYLRSFQRSPVSCSGDSGNFSYSCSNGSVAPSPKAVGGGDYNSPVSVIHPAAPLR